MRLDQSLGYVDSAHGRSVDCYFSNDGLVLSVHAHSQRVLMKRIDYRHHATDVLVGSLLGLVMAYYSYRLCTFLFHFIAIHVLIAMI